LRATVKAERASTKEARAAAKAEKAAAREVRATVRAEKKAARIAKMEAKLMAMKSAPVGVAARKAARKPSKVKVMKA
jgi:hypothetical protein